jgi:hypothetical protein
MEEEDIITRFEDKKELLVKGYTKKMDSILMDEEKSEEEKDKKKDKEKTQKTPEEIKVLAKKYGEEFKKQSETLRNKFDSKILKLRNKGKNKELNKVRFKKIFAPFVWTFKTSFNGIKTFFKFLMREKKSFDGFYFENVKSKKQRRKQRVDMRLSSFFAPERLFYHQKIWPILHDINAPNRAMKIKIAKFKEELKKLIKNIIKLVTDKIKKIIKFITEKIGAALGKIKEGITKIIATIKKIGVFFKNLIEIIKIKYLHKEDEKDEDEL